LSEARKRTNSFLSRSEKTNLFIFERSEKTNKFIFERSEKTRFSPKARSFPAKRDEGSAEGRFLILGND